MGRRKEVLAKPESKLLLWLMRHKGNSGSSGSEVQWERIGCKLE